MRAISVASRPSPRMFDTALPKPNESFRWVQAAGGPALVCAALEARVPHLLTTRDWRLGRARDSDEREAWADVADAMAVDVEDLLRVRQVHGAAVAVRRIGDARQDLGRADIIIS